MIPLTVKDKSNTAAKRDDQESDIGLAHKESAKQRCAYKNPTVVKGKTTCQMWFVPRCTAQQGGHMRARFIFLL